MTEEEGARQAPYAALVDTLFAAWDALTVFPAKSTPAEDARQGIAWTRREPLPQRAYLLFNRWEGNALAQQLEAAFPGWARDRFTVPDAYFEGREERAPIVLELPEEFILPEPGSARKMSAQRDWLAQCLMQADAQRHERLHAQDFCGVVISPANAQVITRHWVGLGDQRPPHSEASVLFRYQDPRVMQRVWPALSPFQQAQWLGPVTQWWALQQPWGPYAGRAEPAQWFQAKAPLLPRGTPTERSPVDMFDEDQWFLAGVSPDANAIWQGYARNHIPAQAQPDPHSMVRMLTDAARLGLTGLNLEDYLWATWQHRPAEGDPHARDWSLPHTAPVLARVLTELKKQPGARFATLFARAIQSKS